MPKFPKREADIRALCDAMIGGYPVHTADFPSSTWWFLPIKRGLYIAAKNAQTAAQVATDNKNASLDTGLIPPLKESEAGQLQIGAERGKM